jgi:putative DNA primase/helicase
MLRLAQSSVPILTDDLDRDPWLLNVANGTVDLRSGELRRHRREDLITKLIDVEYHPDAPCKRWLRFLEEIQPKESTRRYLQRSAGYSATGSARERVVLILHGGGRNGKSVFLQELRTTLGPYAVRMPSETFLAKRQDGAIPNDIAQLRGARMAFGSETGEGRRLAEAKIKEMTGDESISARFMRGEWFDFRPAFTPWLATNHRPVIKGSDAAIWDRIRLVPFNVRFRLPDEPDSGLAVADLALAEKLDAERQGILAWIVRGAVDWYRDGLGAPDDVRYRRVVSGRPADQLAIHPERQTLALCTGPSVALATNTHRGCVLCEQTSRRGHLGA